MKFLLLLLLSPICQAQMNVLPYQVNDQPVQDDFNFLSQKITNLTNSPLVCPQTANNCITFPDGTVMNSTAPFTVAASTLSFLSVATSSGIPGVNFFTFIVNSSGTYDWNFSSSITSGTALDTDGSAVRCTINGDTTAGDYFNYVQTYPNNYQINNAGANAWFSIHPCDSGAVAATDYTHISGRFTTPQGQPKILSFTGTLSDTCATLTNGNTMMTLWKYKGNPPYTVTCFPILGNGFQYKSTLMTLPGF